LAGYVLAGDTPVSKVLELLESMASKAQTAKDKEEEVYTKYRRWCLDTQQETEQQITDGNEKIESLTSAIQKNQATIDDMSRAIAKHDHDIGVWQSDIKSANKIRDTENTAFVKSAKNYDESIDALARAVQVLQQENYSREQTTKLLLQVNIPPFTDVKAIESFLATGNDYLETSGYEFQSKGVVQMLKDLHDKFRQESEELRHTETRNKDLHSLWIDDHESDIKEATREKVRKEGIRAAASKAKAENQTDKTDTTATRDDDQSFLAETTAVCTQKANDFDARDKLRGEEIAALKKATEILSSPDVSGAAEKHLPQLMQKKISLLQFMQTESPKNQEEKDRVASYLKIQGAKLHSKIISALAMRVANDPFVKVKKMIQDLVVRLQEEANNEATQKEFCDKELDSNEQTRKEKTSRVETLHAESDMLNATIQELAESIAQLQAEIAQINKDVQQATEIRTQEKADNKIAIRDAIGAQKAVAEALKVLQVFYTKAGKATALVQGEVSRPRSEAPPVFDRPYNGLQAENGGVLGILEVIQSDFARLESETKASEEQSQKEFDEFIANANVNKKQKQTDIEHKMVRKQDTEQQLQETTSDLEGTQDELSAALKEYHELYKSCLDTGLNYEERVQAREEEIKSLKQALKLLEDPDATV